MAYKTVTKELIIDFLNSNPDTAFTVDEIKEHLEEKNNNANITTIYRILDKLYEENCLMKFLDEDKKRYTYKYVPKESGCFSHMHLKCSGCGKIIHLDCDHSKMFIEHIYKEHGFSINCENAVLYGLCDECRKKEEKNKK